MERNKMTKTTIQNAERAKVLHIDGCKVTVRYSEQDNPSAVKHIKDALFSGCSVRKS